MTQKWECEICNYSELCIKDYTKFKEKCAHCLKRYRYELEWKKEEKEKK